MSIAGNSLAEEVDEVRFSDCKNIEDTSDRLACYDRFAEKWNQMSSDKTETDGSENGAEEGDALDRRLKFEQNISDNRFIIIPHHPNYILLYTYNHNPNKGPYSPTQERVDKFEDVDRSEAKFQISFKVQLARNFLPDSTSLWFAYTQRSYWQVYNQEQSAPFRESNYEPELILLYKEPLSLFGYSSEYYAVGINHQSNGRSDPLSRSWNRIFAGMIFNKGNLALMVRPWWRLPEDESKDDNPDIESYLGYSEFGVTYKREDKDAVYNMRLFNNFRTDDNKTSVELSYSFPLGGRLKGYIQYYNGYGESLLDYNHRTKRIGIGILLTDWY
ncbi:phospholipase [Hahella sp. CCB-MM4]|uniref:phospholipase A n=1 Tax=Hahella sp. (strain CCB-MM4) TaxID=1926491 RepID=UPI000BD7EB22|nr:phospholipase A [Hahella sp. CCB-MM4]OZG71543.1 phospholipase [Hahella sp. CCB-MM4]